MEFFLLLCYTCSDKDRVGVMKSREKLLELLSRYGFETKYNDPFLYEQDGKYGLVYRFSHAFYGLLTRVLFLDNENEILEFLYQYWWYKKYGEEFDVMVELDDYEILEIIPKFKLGDRVLTSKDMKNMLLDPDELYKDEKNMKLYQRYLRTANILIQIMREKIKTQNDTQRNVIELDNELKRQENEFLQLFNRYQKDNKPLHVIKKDEENFSLPHEIDDLTLQLEWFSKHESMSELKEFIDSLWQSLLSLETSKQYLEHKYLLVKLPLDLEDVRKKKAYMEFVFNRKKGLFSKKEQVIDSLKKIEESSESKKIVSMKDYIKNEVQRLKDKYSIISEMDYTTLGDYLNEFDNLGIQVPFDLKEVVIKKYTYSKFVQQLEDIYQSLSREEQQSLSIYHSFLEPICDVIMNYVTDRHFEEEIERFLEERYANDLQDAMRVLSDPENVFVRMKQMKLLSLSSRSSFCKSLIQVVKTVASIQSFHIPGICYIFGKSSKSDQNFSIYHASCRAVGSPAQKRGNYDIQDIIELHENVLFQYFPTFYFLRDPYFHDDTLEEEKREDILLNFRNYQVNFKNSDIIRVARYRIVKDGKDVTNIQLMATENYRHIVVTSR